jgi:hypothetical protein
MSKRLKSHPIDESSRIKTVEETTKIYEHKCNPACFRPLRKRTPPDLRRVNLGHVYMSSDGGFYIRFDDGDWLPVEGMDFGRTTDGKLFKIFNPTVQLHIHSPGGRTIAKAVEEKEIDADEHYHAEEVAKKRARKGDNLIDMARFFGATARKVKGYAPKKRKQPKGTGKGAPGQPRRPFSKKVVALRDAGTPEHKVVEEMIIWLREQGEHVTPLDHSNIKKRVHRWFLLAKKKSGHKKARTSAPYLSVLE